MVGLEVCPLTFANISLARPDSDKTHARTNHVALAGGLASAGCRVRVGVDEQRLSVGKVEIRGLSVAGLVTRVMDESRAGRRSSCRLQTTLKCSLQGLISVIGFHSTHLPAYKSIKIRAGKTSK